MSRIDLNSLGVSLNEVEAALELERRPEVRKRLLALKHVLAGKTIHAAKRAAGVTWESVRRWVVQVQQGGLDAILADAHSGLAKRKLPPAHLEALQQDIDRAIEQPLKPHVRSRLVAIRAVLSGRASKEAAATAQVNPTTVGRWLDTVRRSGLAAALERWERRPPEGRFTLEADPAMLRTLAAQEKNARIRKGILALAEVADGKSALTAAMNTGTSHSTLLTRVKRFQEEGLAACHDRQPSGRPKKLTQAQLEELRLAVLGRPEMSYDQLRDFIHARFGARYSFPGLQLLLKREFGIERGGFIEGLGEGLNLVELREAAARAENWSTKNKLTALIQLAEGEPAEAVARSRGMYPETLRKWVEWYRRSVSADLRGTQ
jgi:transposase